MPDSGPSDLGFNTAYINPNIQIDEEGYVTLDDRAIQEVSCGGTFLLNFVIYQRIVFPQLDGTLAHAQQFGCLTKDGMAVVNSAVFVQNLRNLIAQENWEQVSGACNLGLNQPFWS